MDPWIIIAIGEPVHGIEMYYAPIV
jgi:hypothetical protein